MFFDAPGGVKADVHALEVNFEKLQIVLGMVQMELNTATAATRVTNVVQYAPTQQVSHGELSITKSNFEQVNILLQKGVTFVWAKAGDAPAASACRSWPALGLAQAAGSWIIDGAEQYRYATSKCERFCRRRSDDKMARTTASACGRMRWHQTPPIRQH